jgi:hypothetical protein
MNPSTEQGETVAVEQEYAKSRVHRDTEVLAETTVFSPTCLTDDNGAVTLFLWRYRLLRLPRGRLVVRFMADVEYLPDADALTERVEPLSEMPSERPSADWLPDAIRAGLGDSDV